VSRDLETGQNNCLLHQMGREGAGKAKKLNGGEAYDLKLVKGRKRIHSPAERWEGSLNPLPKKEWGCKSKKDS